MTTAIIGAVTVGGLIPGAAIAYGAVEGNLRGQLAAAGSLKASLTGGPPTVAAAAQIGANVAAAVTSPTFGIALSANLDVIAALEAQLAALAGIFAALGTAGIVLLASETTLNAFGGEVTAAVSGGITGAAPADSVHALTLVATTPAAWAALAQLMRTA
jgi:hypothetical protein